MKVLVDTCVWSLSFRRKLRNVLRPDEQALMGSLAEAINDGRAAIIGPIRQEVLSGIKEDAQFKKLKSALESFPDALLTTRDYEDAARLFNVCRSRGVACGPIDILICAVVIRQHWAVLTSDAGLKRCMEVLTTEGLAS